MRLSADSAWLEGVRRLSSPNCDARPDDCAIDLLVIHGISLPPGRFGGPHVDALFSNTLDTRIDPYFVSICDLRVSAHVLIQRNGNVTQYVPFDLRAWHAGESSFKGRLRCNDFSIGVELEGADDIPYENIQYQRLASLTRLLTTAWPGITRDRIVGHCDIAPGRKTDPGGSFDWTHFHELLDKRV